MSEYAAVLLAGGRSSRMGRDKALLPHPHSGLPLFEHQLATLRSAGAAPILLSLRPDQAYASASACLRRIHDSGEQGPLGALAAAFAALATPPTPGPPPTHMLALAVDMPFVTATFLRRLQAATGPGIGQVPLHPAPDRLEPLCAVYPLSTPCHDALRRAFASGHLSLQAVLRTGLTEGWMRSYPITNSDLPELKNWNIPDDLTL